VRLIGASTTLSREDRARNREAMRALRLGVSWNHPPALLAAQRLSQALGHGSTHFEPLQLNTGPFRGALLSQLLNNVEAAFDLGRLVVTEGGFPLLEAPPEFALVERRLPTEPLPPPAPRAQPKQPLTLFDVRFVDEVGQAISGLDVEITAGDRLETLATNGAGIALLENVTTTSASVSIVDAEALEAILVPRWEKQRSGSEPRGVNTTAVVFTGADVRGIALKAAVPNTVVIKPPIGKLFVELWDKTGRLRHVEQRYSITGPQAFEGTTDELGRLLHEAVPHGDYELTLTVQVEGANGEMLENTYTSPLIVLEATEATPQLRMLGAVRSVVMARMRGMLFDTNKCFLLPSSLEALGQIRRIYDANNRSELLIVGHTDKTGEPDINDPLSVERAKSTQAYLEEDVDAWLDNYDLPGKKQWGTPEDHSMIAAMPDFDTRAEDEDIVVWFQRTRKLEVDGKAGKQTRTQLIKEYMTLDGVKLSEEPNFRVNVQTHGAGENFPLDGTGFELDDEAVDGQADALDRRVELFFFDPDFKILPEAGAPDGREYLEWRKRAAQSEDFSVEGMGSP